jgi:murein DD-endopeptidase MepM/ murein hydrolase activator NlpD
MRFVICVIFSMYFVVYSQDLSDFCKDFDHLNTQIRDQNIDTAVAKKEFENLIQKIKPEINYLPKAKEWVFPLQGYTPKYIGGKNGEGYVPQGYDYFTGNNHKAHPAHDIFIHDFNQDCIDDARKKYVNILSVTEGIVIACTKNWDTTSNLRGGIYVWVYCPSEDCLFYYAHLNSISVDVGSIVQAGQSLGTVGRTGLNAYKKRSPTHLHFSMFSVKTNLPVPQNPYQKLCSARCVP